jgi:hypothetical protein
LDIWGRQFHAHWSADHPHQRRSGDTGHAHIEPRIDACGSRLCEQNFDERAGRMVTLGALNTRSWSDWSASASLLPLAFKISMPVVSIPFLDGLEATNRSQSVCAVRSQG